MGDKGKSPRFHRPMDGRHIGWEYYHWRLWFVTISIGTFEIQLNKWRRPSI